MTESERKLLNANVEMTEALATVVNAQSKRSDALANGQEAIGRLIEAMEEVFEAKLASQAMCIEVLKEQVEQLRASRD